MIRQLATIAAATLLAMVCVAEEVTWTTQSHNSSESMPAGGYDTGLNVWVEKSTIYAYICRSGSFDEHNTLLKAGRVAIVLSPDPFGGDDFSQTLDTSTGTITIRGGGATVTVWGDTSKPVVHFDVTSLRAVNVDASYQSWRYRDRQVVKDESNQGSYKWRLPADLTTKADRIEVEGNTVVFSHHNPDRTVFDLTVEKESLESVKEVLYNPLANLCTGGVMWGHDLRFDRTDQGQYASTDFRAWHLVSKRPTRSEQITVALFSMQTPDWDEWRTGVERLVGQTDHRADRKAATEWWHNFDSRSYICSDCGAQAAARNYTLFRFMIGCNAAAEWPMKFNGGLFTFDPEYVDPKRPYTPDFRLWGGGTMTAQNQRLLAWPLLKSGDVELMRQWWDTYNRILPNAEARVRVYWGHEGACYTEQIEQFGLPNVAEYGYGKHSEGSDRGVERNAWLEYEWDTVLEFCQQILDSRDYFATDITKYEPMIESCLKFFEQHYRMLALKRGTKEFDGDGKLIIFPGSGCETYKMAYNPSSTIAALHSVAASYGKMPELEAVLPPIPLREVEGRTMIAPAKSWERINNVETPQLYPVFPWRIYGVGRDGIEIARNTYLYDSDATAFRSTTGWKQDAIWAACLGLTEQATELITEKMKDGVHRFGAFEGPGFDWTPDLNHLGSGAIALQEMLLQCVGERILLLPAWPKEWNVRFKLYAPRQTTVEAEVRDGVIVKLNVTPKERIGDIETDFEIANTK